MGYLSKIDLSKYSKLNVNSAKTTKYKSEMKSQNDFAYDSYDEINYSQNVDKYNDMAEDFIKVTGDINGDGKVTIQDKSLLEKYMKEGIFSSAYDVNGDGLTNALDVKAIESYLMNDDAFYSYFDLNDLSKPEKVHSVDNLNNMRDSIEKRIKEIKDKKKELEDSIWWDKTIQGNLDFLFHDGNRELKISQTELEIQKLEEELSFLSTLRTEVESSMNLQPYDKIAASYEFQKYYREHENDEIYIKLDYGAMQDEVSLYEQDVNQYLTQEQKVLYKFLLEKEGKTTASRKAAEYLGALENTVNKAKGAKLADEFLTSLNYDDEGKIKEDLWNIFCSSGQGLDDGIRTFHEGIKNIIDNGNKLTAEDYRKMIILQYLSENSKVLEGTYEFSSSFGNMVPSLVASALVSYAATPAAGSVVGSVLMGASAGGNAKHQALTKGSSIEIAVLYGILSGTSEATLGYYLGKIPGISKMSGLTFGNLLSEGAEEYLQEWVDAGLQAVVLGEDIDWNEVPKNAEKSFVMGILMSGFLNGGQKIVNIRINGSKTSVNVEEILEYIHEHPNAEVEDAIKECQPSLYNKLYGVKKNKVDTAAIDAKIRQLSQGNVHKVPEAIRQILSEQYNSSRNNADLRYICRSGMDILIKGGYSKKAAASIIGQQYSDVLAKVGFDTYTDPNTGIKVNVMKGMNWNYQPNQPNTIMDEINKLPAEFRSLIKEVNFYDTFNPYDFHWENKYNINNFISAATGGRGTINIWATIKLGLNTVAHETAHSYDTAYASIWGVETQRISESQMWRDAMKNDYNSSGLNGVTEYARSSNSPVEDFAEAVSLYYTNPNALDAFPARKAILQKYLPSSNSISTAYDTVYDIMVNKYGVREAEGRLQRYYNTGDISIITRDGGARDIIKKFSIDEFRQYINEVEMQKVNDKFRAIENSFNLCMTALEKKYGFDTAIKQMQAFINTGNVSYITSTDGARQSIQYDITDYRRYIQSINNGSTDISQLYGGY